MLSCDEARDRLLARTDPRRLPDEVRGHLDGCPGCRAYLAAVGRLDGLLARVPVPPPSPAAKAATLAAVADGPIIRTVPAVRPPGWAERQLDRINWRPVTAVAAGLLVAAGAWWAATTPTGPNPPPLAYRRHELLQKEVTHVAALATADTAPAKMAVWATVSEDLAGETAALYLVAPEDELKSLGAMFRRAVADGIGRQATRLPDHLPPADRRKLADVADRLKGIETRAADLSAVAPPQSKDVLRQMAADAAGARARLAGRLKGGA